MSDEQLAGLMRAIIKEVHKHGKINHLDDPVVRQHAKEWPELWALIRKAIDHVQ